MSASRARFVVVGRVQGVNFRWVTVEVASRHGITGRVWNRPDGAVEVIAEGTDEQLGALKRWLGEGPPSARVESVTMTRLEGARRFADFRVSPGDDA